MDLTDAQRKELDKHFSANLQAVNSVGQETKYYLNLHTPDVLVNNNGKIENKGGLSRFEIDKDTFEAFKNSTETAVATRSDTNVSLTSEIAAKLAISRFGEGTFSDFEYLYAQSKPTPETPYVDGEAQTTAVLGDETRRVKADIDEQFNTTTDKHHVGNAITGVNASATAKKNDTSKGGNGGTDGAANSGTGSGANDKDAGIGYGIGSGEGNDIGDGSGSKSSSTSFNSSKGETPLGNVAYNGATDNGDAQAIASYLDTIGGEAPINHIFHNDFYNSQPVSHWAFSVDFIPAAYLRTMTQEDMFEMSRTLTKAVLTVDVPERVLQTTVSHYKGMTIELPSRAKTSGSLNMTFAETASFPISTILNNLFQYARSDNYFENTDYIETAMRKNAKSEDQFNMQKQILKSYRAALPKGGHLFNILVKMYRMEDTRMLEDAEEDQYPTFVYYYKGCDLKSVRQIEFDYNSDKPIDVSCEWIYQYFEELTFEEYSQRYGSVAEEEDTGLQEDAIEQKMNESFKDVLPSNQKTMNDIVDGFSNSDIVKKMRSRKATSQMKGYTPSNVSNSAPAYSTAGNYDRSYRG